GEKAQEVGRGDRLDLFSQPIERVAMDAREKAPAAPPRPALEPTAEHEALALELVEKRIVADDGPERLEPAPQDLFRIARRLVGEPTIALELGAARARELGEPFGPRAPLVDRDVPHPQEGLVHLFDVRGRGPRFLAHAADGFGIERAELVGALHVERAARNDALR